MAVEQRLRGYDAVHLAAAESITDPQTVFVCWDAALTQAANALGLASTP